MKPRDYYPHHHMDMKKKTLSSFYIFQFFLEKPGLSSGVWMHLISGIIFLPEYWNNNIFKPFQSRTLFKADAMLLQ